MNLLTFIDKLSFKQILSIAILLAIVFALPTTVWLVSQQTRLYSSAHKENLPNNNYTQEPFGAPSQSAPKISKILPFLGKVDDVVFIIGQNFGQNPQNRAVYFGGVKADERDILRWHDDQIDVMVPSGAVSGNIRVVEVDKEDTYVLPFTVYDRQTQTRVYWDGPALIADNAFSVSRAQAVGQNGQTYQSDNVSGAARAILFSNVTKDLQSIALYDRGGNLVSFWVNPIDFGF